MPEPSIAHYRIKDKLGAGGMGEVYRAMDTRLNREVAIKVLPEAFAQDPDRMARFRREAQVLASLNHPNIASIHGLEESGGERALVMELVEGETLAQRLERGAISLEEAVAIAGQIAEALEEAHERGFIHRDLKPANVKIRPDGAVKVLDFGLAKALEDEASGSAPDLSQSPTMSAAATRAGVIMGTAAYMSPEQARGQKVDRRADIWSFGVLLLEMLTGRAVYSGETVSDVLAKVLEREPDWDALPETTPSNVRRLLRRCLEKSVKRRLQAMGEARLLLEDYLEEPSDAAGASAQPEWQRAAPWVVTALAVVASLFAFASRSPEPPAAPMRLAVEVSPSVFSNFGPGAALSPDGTRLAYVVTESGSTKLYIRALDQLEGVPLSGTDGAFNPFFSPDGQWVAFATRDELKKVSVSGGAPLTLCEVNISRGGSWGEDDTIVFAPARATGLSRVSAAGGEPEILTEIDEEGGERTHRWPQFLSGAKAVLFSALEAAADDFNDGNIVVLDLASGERKILHRGGFYARYAPSGHIVFVHEDTLFAAPFDMDRLELSGAPAPIIEGVRSNPRAGSAALDFSRTGLLVYSTGSLERGYSMVWVDREARVGPLWEEHQEYSTPRFSADGRFIAVDTEGNAGRDLWVYDLERGIPTRLTFGASDEDTAVWSPDGEYLYYASFESGNTNLYRKRADGSGPEERLTDSSETQYPSSMSPDGRYLAFHQSSVDNGFDIWMLPIEGEQKPELFLQTTFPEREADFSPDGRFVAYQSLESGSDEVYVRPFPAASGKWQISSGGGSYPRWSRDGRELFYRVEEGIMAVSVDTTGRSFRAEKPRLLIDGTFIVHSQAADFDIAPDGKRFVMFQGDDVAEDVLHTHLTIVTDWFEDLRRTFSTE